MPEQVADLQQFPGLRVLRAWCCALKALRAKPVLPQPAMRGGESAPVEKDGRLRPHQPGANLVFLSARPESYKVRTTLAPLLHCHPHRYLIGHVLIKLCL